MNWIVLRTVLLLLASGTMFILATRTRNKTFIIASLVAVSLVYFLNNFFAQTTWPFRILYACPFIVFWGFIAIERLAPRSPIAGFTGDESLKSAAMIAFRGMTVTLGVLLYATLWKTWHPFSLSLSRKIPICEIPLTAVPTKVVSTNRNYSTR